VLLEVSDGGGVSDVCEDTVVERVEEGGSPEDDKEDDGEENL
jgi:hypothetical protein